MKKEVALAIVEACVENGIEARVREDYGGRGMYSATTTGVVFGGSASGLVEAIIRSAHLFTDDEGDAVFGEPLQFHGMDNMGYDTIIY